MAQDLCARLREKKLISIVRGAPTEKITKIADAIYPRRLPLHGDHV